MSRDVEANQYQDFSREITRLVEKPCLADLAYEVLTQVEGMRDQEEGAVIQQVKDWSQLEPAQRLSRENVIRLTAGVVNLAERTLIDDNPAHAEQIEGVLALLAMNSAEISCNQGKSSFILPAAMVARHLLTGEQIHLMTANPYLKERDGQTLNLLARRLGLRVDLVDGGEDIFTDIEGKKRSLYIADYFLDWLDVDEDRRNAFKTKIRQQLESLLVEATKFRLRKETKAFFTTPIEQAVGGNGSQIVVGHDRDFVFSYLFKHHQSPWQKGQTSLYIDEEMALASASPYIIKRAGKEIIEDYLLDWIMAAITESVCSYLDEENLVILDEKGNWTFAGEQSWDIWSEKITAALEKPHKILSLRLFQVLENVIMAHLKLAFNEAGIDFDLEKSSVDLKAFIETQVARFREEAEDFAMAVQRKHPNNTIESISYFDRWALAWLEARNIKKGREYVEKDGEGLLLRHVETGHPLVGHHYRDLLPFILETREGVCTFDPSSALAEDRIGFASFLQQAYGHGHVGVTSGTLKYLREEIEAILGGRVREIPRWRGEAPIIPKAHLMEDRSEALEVLRDQFAVWSGSEPLILICDDDQELDWLRRQFQEINIKTVDTRTSVEEEMAVYQQAEKEAICIFVNPRASRGVDIQKKAKWIIWGPLNNEALLHQILERNRNNQGEMDWIVYRSDPEGSCGLGQTEAVRGGREMEIKVIHRWNEQRAKTARLVQYLFDELLNHTREEFFRELKRIYGNYFTDRCLRDHFVELFSGPEQSLGEYFAEMEERLSAVTAQITPHDFTSYNRVLAEYFQRERADKEERKKAVAPKVKNGESGGLLHRLQTARSKYIEATGGIPGSLLSISVTAEYLLFDFIAFEREAGETKVDRFYSVKFRGTKEELLEGDQRSVLFLLEMIAESFGIDPEKIDWRKILGINP